MQPDLLVLDEPTSSLDIHVQGIVLDLLKKLQRLENLTYLFISHDLGVMAEIADRVAVLYQGKIIEQGIMEEILYNPREKYTEKLISAFLIITSNQKYLPATYEGKGIKYEKPSNHCLSTNVCNHQTRNKP